MASLSNYAASALNDHLNSKTAFTMPAAIWAALVTTNSTAAAAGTEATYGSYARVQIPAASFNASANGSATNSALIQWPARSDAGSQTVVGVAFFDASAAGNFLRYANGLSLAVTQGIQPKIDIGQLTTSMS